MAISSNLMKAILALDSYNRGYKSGLDLDDVHNSEHYSDDREGLQIGTAVIKNALGDEDAQAIGFYGIAYTYNGEVVVAYRGTDDMDEPSENRLDIPNGWLVGIGKVGQPQANMAFEFYKSVAESFYLPGSTNIYLDANISLTGHSMGGGLAGLVASVYNQDAVLFDSMAFESAASSTASQAASHYITYLQMGPHGNWFEQVETFSPGDPAMAIRQQELEGMQNVAAVTVSTTLNDLVYNGGASYGSLDYNGITGYAVNGEALGFNRWLQSSAVETLNVSADLGGLSDEAVNRHSQSLLVIRMFAEEDEVTSSAWEHAEQYFWPVLFNKDFAEKIGFDPAGTGGEDTADAKLRSILAYSAINEGTRVFGDTGIRAFYNDASDLGTVLDTPDHSSSLETFATDISRVFVQYAGHLAQNKILQSANGTAVNGVLKVEGDFLDIDFSDDVWKMGTNTLPPMVARQMLMESLSTTVSAGALMTVIGQIYGANALEHIEKISFVIDEAGGSYTIAAPDANKVHVFVAEQLNHITNGDDSITGSSGHDIILSGDGDDSVFGGPCCRRALQRGVKKASLKSGRRIGGYFYGSLKKVPVYA